MRSKYQNFVETCGSPRFPRYRIRSRTQGYWTGDNWNLDSSCGKLYYKFQDAANELAQLELELYKNKSLGKYEVTVKVEVFGDTPVDLNKLKDYLSDTVRLELTKPAPDKSTVHVSIDWDNLAEGGTPSDRAGRSRKRPKREN